MRDRLQIGGVEPQGVFHFCQLRGAPLALRVPARVFAWNPTDAQALPSGPVEGKDAEIISLVPYGCTKFRISMFPVTARAWRRPSDGN